MVMKNCMKTVLSVALTCNVNGRSSSRWSGHVGLVFGLLDVDADVGIAVGIATDGGITVASSEGNVDFDAAAIDWRF